jgi:predicted transcriptional regulator
MNLFPQTLFNAIKAGNMTLTFRLWDSCRLSQGKSYVVENLGRILIKEAKKIPVSSITDADAKRAGYENTEKILFHFKQKNPDLDPQKDCCYRIEFQYLAEKDRRGPGKPSRPLSPHLLDKYSERLKRMDRRAQGITFSAILKEMSKSAFNKMTNLIDHFQCEYPEMKRKLHRLSEEQLIESDERKRFQLTSRGRQLIEYLESKLQTQPKS